MEKEWIDLSSYHLVNLFTQIEPLKGFYCDTTPDIRGVRFQIGLLQGPEKIDLARRRKGGRRPKAGKARAPER